jgi:hypothetical protein
MDGGGDLARSYYRPGSHALDREDTLRLLGELDDMQRRLDLLREGLRALLEDDGGEGP